RCGGDDRMPAGFRTEEPESVRKVERQERLRRRDDFEIELRHRVAGAGNDRLPAERADLRREDLCRTDPVEAIGRRLGAFLTAAEVEQLLRIGEPRAELRREEWILRDLEAAGADGFGDRAVGSAEIEPEVAATGRRDHRD